VIGCHIYHIQEEIKSRHLVQNLLYSSLLSKNIKLKTYRTIFLPIMYGCEIWLLTLREECRLRFFENIWV
jgi:hypothetical protein